MEAFKADVLHQDISGGNILITDDGHALLIDWELAKRLSEEKSPRQDWRTVGSHFPWYHTRHLSRILSGYMAVPFNRHPRRT